MNNPQFYIFGVPDGFDMYNATPEKVKFFQLMYNDQCHDNRRMVIHRNADNSEVTYIYLRYNMRSYSNRPASFLGLALTFSGGYYCKDISLLLNLFEIIYKGLSSDVVLSTKIPAGQGRYTVRRFAERTEAIIKTEEFVESQTQGWFGQSVILMDETFILGNQSTVMKNVLSLDTKPEHVIANMKTAAWVYLSDRQTGSASSSANAPSQLRPDRTPIKKTQQPERLQHPHNVETPPSHTSPQQPQQVVKNGDLDGEQKRQLTELGKIKADFEKERDSYYKYNSKRILYGKQERFEVLRIRLNSLSIIRDTPDGVRQNSLITDEIRNIDNRLYQIEQSVKKKKWIFGGVGGVLLVVFLVILFPKKEPPTPTGGDYGWSVYYVELTDSIENIDGSINRWYDSINKYSQKYSANNDYELAKNSLIAATSEKDSARNSLLEFNKVLLMDSNSVVEAVSVIKNHIAASRKALSECENAWSRIKVQLNDQEDPRKKEEKTKQDKVTENKTDEKNHKAGSREINSQKWNIQVTGNPKPQVESDGKNTWHVYSGTNNPVTIQVTNNGKPVDVVWTWTDATVAILGKVQSYKTECPSIRAALKGGKSKGRVQFKMKEDDEYKYTVWLDANK